MTTDTYKQKVRWWQLPQY